MGGWTYHRVERTIGTWRFWCSARLTTNIHLQPILHFVTNLRTVLVAGTGEITKNTIPWLHKSFVEFITSSEANELFLDVIDVEIGLKCLQVVSRLRNNDERSSSPSAIETPAQRGNSIGDSYFW